MYRYRVPIEFMADSDTSAGTAAEIIAQALAASDPPVGTSCRVDELTREYISWSPVRDE